MATATRARSIDPKETAPQANFSRRGSKKSRKNSVIHEDLPWEYSGHLKGLLASNCTIVLNQPTPWYRFAFSFLEEFLMVDAVSYVIPYSGVWEMASWAWGMRKWKNLEYQYVGSVFGRKNQLTLGCPLQTGQWWIRSYCWKVQSRVNW